jgi:hypothetical protein
MDKPIKIIGIQRMVGSVNRVIFCGKITSADGAVVDGSSSFGGNDIRKIVLGISVVGKRGVAEADDGGYRVSVGDDIALGIHVRQKEVKGVGSIFVVFGEKIIGIYPLSPVEKAVYHARNQKDEYQQQYSVNINKTFDLHNTSHFCRKATSLSGSLYYFGIKKSRIFQNI